MKLGICTTNKYNIVNNTNNIKSKGINFKCCQTICKDTFVRTTKSSFFASEMDRIKLSKKISCLLRHTPQFYNLVLDKEGWTSIDFLIAQYNQRHDALHQITAEHLQEMSDKCNKGRFEIKDGRIRALYGHSIKFKIEKPSEIPPEILYHGTSQSALKSILKNGLLPRKRQYVHLAKDVDTAIMNGKRKDHSPIILAIDAKKAYNDGNKFYRGNELIWLADTVSPKYIRELKY